MSSRGASRWTVMVRTPLGAASSLLVLVIVVLAIAAPSVFGAGASTDHLSRALEGPSGVHFLGTDALGRDLFDRVLVATRLSMVMAVLATLIATIGGLLIGAATAVVGNRVAGWIGAAINLAVAFPSLLLAMFLSIIFGLGEKGAVLAIGIAGIPAIARLAQTLTASVADADYVSAARMLEVGRTRIVIRHVLPNIAEPLVISVTLSLGGALLSFAALSFIGLGVQAPRYDWGEMLNQGLPQITTDPWASLGPAAAVVLAGLAFNLLGDAISRALGTEGQSAFRLGGRPKALRRELPADPADALVGVKGLQVAFPTNEGWVRPVDDVGFELAPGEIVGIVGESGSGKSLTALGVSQLIEAPAVVTADVLRFQGVDLLEAGLSELKPLLGTSMSMVFQDPLSALNPAMKVGAQLAEVTRVHLHQSRSESLARAVDRLRAVRIPDPQRRASQYPHELSGGMRQRAVIGMGLMAEPKLIVADEPTTALDVTIQSRILDLLRTVRDERGAAILFISHDIAVVGQLCGRVMVMYAGRIVEELPASDLKQGAAHPYTRALVATVPDMAVDRDQPLPTIAGRPPTPGSLPSGCAFAPRCPRAQAKCSQESPELVVWGSGRRVACWYPHVDGGSPSEHVVASAGEEQ